MPDPHPRSRWSMRILRNAAGPIFLMLLAGGIMLAVGKGLDDQSTRTDSFAILRGKGAESVVRLDLPDGWHVKTSGLKKGYATALFAPGGTFAFEVTRDVLHESLETFVGWHRVEGARVDVRPGAAGEVAAARRAVPDNFSSRWRLTSDGAAVQVTYFAGPRTPCVRFTMRGADAARLEPEAFRISQTAESLPPDDPRADNRATNETTRAWKDRLWSVGLWLVISAVVLVVAVPWTALFFQVREAAAGHPGLMVIGRPTMSAKPNRQLEAFEHGREGLAALGFQHVGWFRIDDFDETHISAWRHPEYHAVAFVLYFPVTGVCRLRIIRRFADGWFLASSTRLPDMAYAMPPHTYLQARRCSAAELWAWHLEAETLFPARSAARFDSPSPREVYVEWSRRVARHHQSVWLWFVRYEPFGECWRILRRRGVSVRSQIDRGWVTDPDLTFPDPDGAIG